MSLIPYMGNTLPITVTGGVLNSYPTFGVGSTVPVRWITPASISPYEFVLFRHGIWAGVSQDHVPLATITAGLWGTPVGTLTYESVLHNIYEYALNTTGYIPGIYEMCWAMNGRHRGAMNGSISFAAAFELTPSRNPLYGDDPERVELNARVAAEKARYVDETIIRAQIEAGRGIRIIKRDSVGFAFGYDTWPDKADNIIFEADPENPVPTLTVENRGPFGSLKVDYGNLPVDATLNGVNRISFQDTYFPEFDLDGNVLGKMPYMTHDSLAVEHWFTSSGPDSVKIESHVRHNNLWVSHNMLPPMGVLRGYETTNRIEIEDTETVTWDVDAGIFASPYTWGFKQGVRIRAHVEVPKGLDVEKQRWPTDEFGESGNPGALYFENEDVKKIRFLDSFFRTGSNNLLYPQNYTGVGRVRFYDKTLADAPSGPAKALSIGGRHLPVFFAIELGSNGLEVAGFVPHNGLTSTTANHPYLKWENWDTGPESISFLLSNPGQDAEGHVSEIFVSDHGQNPGQLLATEGEIRLNSERITRPYVNDGIEDASPYGYDDGSALILGAEGRFRAIAARAFTDNLNIAIGGVNDVPGNPAAPIPWSDWDYGWNALLNTGKHVYEDKTTAFPGEAYNYRLSHLPDPNAIVVPRKQGVYFFNARVIGTGLWPIDGEANALGWGRLKLELDLGAASAYYSTLDILEFRERHPFTATTGSIQWCLQGPFQITLGDESLDPFAANGLAGSFRIRVKWEYPRNYNALFDPTWTIKRAELDCHYLENASRKPWRGRNGNERITRNGAASWI